MFNTYLQPVHVYVHTKVYLSVFVGDKQVIPLSTHMVFWLLTLDLSFASVLCNNKNTILVLGY